MNMPPVKQSYYPFGGGLDLLTPAIALREGVCIDAQNYEPEISGGYRRIDGNERYDGQLSPTSANYWTMTATITGTLTIGQTVTGLTSAATGRVLNVVGTAIVLGRVIGLFQIGEVLQVGGISQATTTTLAALNGSDVASDDAANSLLAANDIRQDILE